MTELTRQMSSPEAARELSRRLGEPAWLAERRAGAWEAYADTPFPHRAAHLWRYTDPAEMEPNRDPLHPSPGSGAAVDVTIGDSLSFGRIRDGAVALGSQIQSPSPGVTVGSIARAAADDRASLERVFLNRLGPQFGRLDAMNAAAFQTGVFVRIARNAVVERPIVLRHLLGVAGIGVTRAAILVEEGASATIVEEFEGGTDGAGTAKGGAQLYHASEIEVGPNAKVQHVIVQTLGRRTTAYLAHRAGLARGAHYRPILAAFGGALTKVDLGAVLAGEGAESEMAGFLSGVGRQRFDHHTVHTHEAGHTRSNLNFRTVLSDRARSAYTGLIRIEIEARYSEAYQENRNLLLSPHCRADSIPELEILNQEVQCKHGATVGPLDPAHLFYLMSRAIPRAEAVRMIVAGHFEETLRSLPEELREALAELLLQRLKEI